MDSNMTDIVIKWKEEEGNIVISPGENNIANVTSDIHVRSLKPGHKQLFFSIKEKYGIGETKVSQEGKEKAFAVAGGKIYIV